MDKAPPVKDYITDAARLIADGVLQPDWLEPMLRRACDHLHILLDGAARFPTRTELRKRLKALAEALKFVESEIENWPFSAMLEDGAGRADVADKWWTTKAAVPRLHAAVHAALDSVRTGHGRDIHKLNQSGLSSPQICAGIVCVAWREVHAVAPAHTGEAAQAACAALWRAAAGGMAGGPGTLNAWRQHIEAAKAAERRLGGLRDYVDEARAKLIFGPDV